MIVEAFEASKLTNHPMRQSNRIFDNFQSTKSFYRGTYQRYLFEQIEWAVTDFFFRIYVGFSIYIICRYAKFTVDLIPKDFLTISMSPFGDAICLGTTLSNLGRSPNLDQSK